MPPIRIVSKHNRLFALVAAFLLFAAHGEIRALVAEPAPPATLAEIEEFRSTGIPEERWADLLEVLGSSGNGSAARSLILVQKPFPASRLVSLLVHSKLAVRLGALDLLEDAAGETFGFDPWSNPPGEGNNARSLAAWHDWAAKGTTPREQASALSVETFRTLAMEIVSGQREKAERAMQRLELFGQSAVPYVEGMLKDQPTLEPGARAALKWAEYRVLLRKLLPRDYPALARRLATGNTDEQAEALPRLAAAKGGALPIIADFIAAPDPLVRETAVDAAFKAGKEDAAPLLLPLLKIEKAESVLHILLRHLGEQKPDGVWQEIAPFLEHPSENVAITAAEALGNLKQEAAVSALVARLDDARWRVRAAALEALAKYESTATASRVEKAMDDPDTFVRVTAAKAYHDLLGAKSHAVLLDRFNHQNELRAPILECFLKESGSSMGSRSGGGPPEQLWTSLLQAPPATILECLNTLEDRSDHEGQRIGYAARFATHANPDVAAAALRLLAGYGKELGQLLETLKKGTPLQQDAVLDGLHLPPGFLSKVLPAASSVPVASGNSPVDRFLNIFSNHPTTKVLPVASREANPEEFRRVLDQFFRTGSPRQRFQAATALVSQGDVAAAEWLDQQMPMLSGLDRRQVAGSVERLPEWPTGPIRTMMTRMLGDSAHDVREKVIEAWLETRSIDRVSGLLEELSRPATLLHPDDIYGYELSSALREQGTKNLVAQWSTKTLGNANILDSTKVFALVLLGQTGKENPALLEPFLASENPWLRRAAARALGRKRLEPHLEALLHDDSAMVRAVIPFLADPHSYGWTHWFDDAHSAEDHETYASETRKYGATFGAWAKKRAETSAGTVSPAVADALNQLLRDPSETVRFEALFALARVGRPINVEQLGMLAPSQPEESRVPYRLGQFINSHYPSLDQSFGVLLPLTENLNNSELPKIEKQFGIQKKAPPLTLESLAKTISLPASSAATSAASATTAAASSPTTKQEESAQPFQVVFFHKVGCRDCERVRHMLEDLRSTWPEMVVDERDMAERSSALLNETLSARFKVPDKLRQVTPAVFTQAGPLLREEVTMTKLGDLLSQTASSTRDPQWLQAGAAETASAQTTIEKRFDALSFSVVLLSGFLDGINPCALTTIVFLLSYLQIARRSPGEILAVGSAFVFSVFATYLVIGLGLAEVLARLAALRFAGTLLNYVLAASALLLAFLSFRDAALAAQGKAGAMTLQLPSGFKERIRGLVRTSARTSRFVLAALAAGVLISVLELACTGQVYLPTIQYMLRDGRKSAFGPLLAYNVAFIIPLVVVFALAWAGLRSETLLRWQQRHTAMVKVLTGFLFLALAALLLFSYRSL